MKRFPSFAPWVLFLLAGCFSVDEQEASYSLNSAVLVHNYAGAFREFVGTGEGEPTLPPVLTVALPIAPEHWTAGDVTGAAAAMPVTTTVGGVATTSSVTCGPEYCVRSVTRLFPRDDTRLDERARITYLRGSAPGDESDRVHGFAATLRYRDQTVSLTEATAPVSGAPWLVRNGAAFGEQDYRTELSRVYQYPDMVSGALPVDVAWRLRTTEGENAGRWHEDAAGWTYAEHVTYAANEHLKSATLRTSLATGTLTAERVLAYASGRSLPLTKLAGTETAWQETGETYVRGKMEAARTPTGWKRTVDYPADQRFTRLTDEGRYPDDTGRGGFDRSIDGKGPEGQDLHQKFRGMYVEKAPGVWQLNANSDDMRLELTYQRIDFHEVVKGLWSHTNGSSASFEIHYFPNWTSRMTYTFDRPETPFRPDEYATLRFAPDTRGLARVSIVQAVSGEDTHHTDRNFAIVAEGQRLP